jgi:hypothetical protein
MKRKNQFLKINYMKKLLIPVISILLFACNPKQQKPTVLITPVGDTTKVIDTTIIEDGPEPITTNAKVKPDHANKREKISCGFGIKHFNQRKRPIEEAPGGVHGKPTKGGGGGTTGGGGSTGTGGTIYLDFWGGTISGTMWNTNGDLIIANSGLGQAEIDGVLSSVTQHYAPYNVSVTNDVNAYNATPVGRRIRVMITTSWEWFGQAGGVAYLNSFFWSDGSPAFVFSSLLGYNVHNIGEAASHEPGHSLSLRHQSDCDNGTLVNQYSLGKTMGNSYYVLLGAWVTGLNPFCAEQNDDAMLTTSIGKR